MLARVMKTVRGIYQSTLLPVWYFCRPCLGLNDDVDIILEFNECINIRRGDVIKEGKIGEVSQLLCLLTITD
jgi:hypothetical protein